MAFLFAACIVLVVVPPLDVRFGWSLMSWQVSIIGDALVALSFYILYLVSKVNTYAAANVRVEEGQKVVSDGMYGYVRHPMYLALCFFSSARRSPSDRCGRWLSFLCSCPYSSLVSSTKNRCLSVDCPITVNIGTGSGTD